MQALLFRSVMSVHAFLRVAHSLWAILVTIFGVFISNYFDDFVAIATADATTSVTAAVTLRFKLLGWIFAETGDKAASVISALGVTFDVSRLGQGLVIMDNTASRKSEIKAATQKMLDDDKRINRHDVVKLRGRLQFVSGQIFGRVSKRCLAVVTKHAYGDQGPALSDESREALKLLLQLISMDIPREVSTANRATWFIFTDVCYEPDDASHVADWAPS